MHFIDDRNGWAVGASGLIFRTQDGGTLWDIQPSGTTMDLDGVHFVDANRGWAVGGFVNGQLGWINGNTGIIRTTDGGAHWTNTRALGGYPSAGGYWPIQFTDAMNGWAVSKTGLIHRSRDGGTTWKVDSLPMYNRDNKEVFAFYMVDENTGWATGDETLVMRYGAYQVPLPNPILVRSRERKVVRPARRGAVPALSFYPWEKSNRAP